MTDTLALPPSVSEAFRLYRDGHPDAALATLTATGSGAEAHAAGQLLLGALALERRQSAAAAAAFRRSAALDPGFGRAYSNLAVTLRRTDRLEPALAVANRALLLEPGHRQVLNVRAATLVDMDRPRDALADAEAVLSEAPEDHEAAVNRGLALQRLGRLAEARAVLDEAVRRRPDDPIARNARAHLLLLLDEMPLGWREREARWLLPLGLSLRELPDVPLWNGESLADRTILVVGDEGRGDMIQYVRLLDLRCFAGARIALQVPSYMVRLFAAAYPSVQVVDRTPDGPFDFQTPLSRVPAVAGLRLDTIPPNTPYLRADPERVAFWRRRIGDNGFRIAVCWQGNPKTLVDRGRSFPLAEFAPLAGIPGVRLIALQARHGTEQLAHLPVGMTVETLGDDYDTGPDSFVDPAAVAEVADLVVTSDTALAHLAGALGRPTWVALRKVPDFRWLLDREDSPWYPTVRLFRQRAEGDWAEVMQRIAAAVRERAAGSG